MPECLRVTGTISFDLEADCDHDLEILATLPGPRVLKLYSTLVVGLGWRALPSSWGLVTIGQPFTLTLIFLSHLAVP